MPKEPKQDISELRKEQNKPWVGKKTVIEKGEVQTVSIKGQKKHCLKFWTPVLETVTTKEGDEIERRASRGGLWLRDSYNPEDDVVRWSEDTKLGDFLVEHSVDESLETSKEIIGALVGKEVKLKIDDEGYLTF